MLTPLTSSLYKGSGIRDRDLDISVVGRRLIVAIKTMKFFENYEKL